MLLSELTTDDGKRLAKINEALRRSCGISLNEEVNRAKLEGLFEKTQAQLHELKMNQKTALDREYVEKILVLEGIKTLLRRVDENVMLGGRGGRKLENIVRQLADFVRNVCEIGDPYEEAIAEAMKHYRSSPYRFDDDLVEYEVRKATTDCEGHAMPHELGDDDDFIGSETAMAHSHDATHLGPGAVAYDDLSGMMEDSLNEAAPPGMENWVKDRKEQFKKEYGDDWEPVLYATAWKQYDKKHHVHSESLEEDEVDGEERRKYVKYKKYDVWKVVVPANVYTGKYYDSRVVQLLVSADVAPTEQAAKNYVLSHEDEALQIIENMQHTSGRRMVRRPVEKNVFFDPNRIAVRGKSWVEAAKPSKWVLGAGSENIGESYRSDKYADIPYDHKQAEENDRKVRRLMKQIRNDPEFASNVESPGAIRGLKRKDVLNKFGVDLEKLWTENWANSIKTHVDKNGSGKYSLFYDRNVRESSLEEARGLGMPKMKRLVWKYWFESDPREIKSFLRNASDTTIAALATYAPEHETGRGSPQDLQRRLLDREIKRRGLDMDMLSPRYRPYDKTTGQSVQDEYEHGAMHEDIHEDDSENDDERLLKIKLRNMRMNFDAMRDKYHKCETELAGCHHRHGMEESAPKGWEGTVKAMKKHKEIDNPYALANYMKNKGYHSHKK